MFHIEVPQGGGEYHLTKPGKYMVILENISGTVVVSCEHSDVEVDILGVFDGFHDDTFTIHTTQLHKAPGSKSNLLVKGVFRDNSSLSYSGLIRIEEGAQGSHAYQKNQNLILSPTAYVMSEPNLEILANDVFCTHGSTTGRPSKETIAYMQTRGLTREQATQLLVDGFFREVYDMIS